jgi:ABC-type Mn2+/Zn2+ transport system ATPase subunit
MPRSPRAVLSTTTTTTTKHVLLFGKKDKRKGGGGGGGGGRGQQVPQEKQSVKDARFDAVTRQFMFTLMGLTKVLPDKSKTILKNINLSFYPDAKIGVVGLNGSGKSTLLKIMAGVETEFDGVARPLPGASIGYLAQEPVLPFETVQECIDEAVQSSQAILDEYNTLSMKLADPDLTPEEMNKILSKTEELTNVIEAKNLWELDRVVGRAMDSLRVPPGNARTAVLSGGEKRRVALCRLLLGNHDMLLLDEPTSTWAFSRSFLRYLPFLNSFPNTHRLARSFSFARPLGCKALSRMCSMRAAQCYDLFFLTSSRLFCRSKVLRGWKNSWSSTKEQWLPLVMIVTIWRMLLSGF